MTRIDRYLKPALDFWNKQLQDTADDHLPRQYKGYVASFGTSIIHCGLLPAVFMFSGKSENSDEDKSFITQGVLAILKSENPEISQNTLFDYVLFKKDTPATVSRICDAVIALKLALRTFKLSDHA